MGDEVPNRLTLSLTVLNPGVDVTFHLSERRSKVCFLKKFVLQKIFRVNNESFSDIFSDVRSNFILEVNFYVDFEILL